MKSPASASPTRTSPCTPPIPEQPPNRPRRQPDFHPTPVPQGPPNRLGSTCNSAPRHPADGPPQRTTRRTRLKPKGQSTVPQGPCKSPPCPRPHLGHQPAPTLEAQHGFAPRHPIPGGHPSSPSSFSPLRSPKAGEHLREKIYSVAPSKGHITSYPAKSTQSPGCNAAS